MCRNIKPLFNFDPPATEEEIRAAALQYVRKVTGYNKPSRDNEAAFEKTIAEIAKNTQILFESLTPHGKQKDRGEEAEKARARNAKRFPTHN
jgi:hypothetical protein